MQGGGGWLLSKRGTLVSRRSIAAYEAYNMGMFFASSNEGTFDYSYFRECTEAGVRSRVALLIRTVILGL